MQVARINFMEKSLNFFIEFVKFCSAFDIIILYLILYGDQHYNFFF
jgi:hypothetical protein